MMRSFCLNTILAVAVLVAGSALPARAEIPTQVQIQVPFSFNVGNVTLPPGSYEIQTHDNGAVIVRAVGGSGAAAAIVSPIGEGAGRDASFVRIGGKYFLSRISFGDGRMVQLPAPHLK
jgi:hypothetical protein